MNSKKYVRSGNLSQPPEGSNAGLEFLFEAKVLAVQVRIGVGFFSIIIWREKKIGKFFPGRLQLKKVRKFFSFFREIRGKIVLAIF